MRRRLMTIAALSMAGVSATPAMAAPSVFWALGFYFPDPVEHRAGGLASSDHGPAPEAATAVAVVTPSTSTAGEQFAAFPDRRSGSYLAAAEAPIKLYSKSFW